MPPVQESDLKSSLRDALTQQVMGIRDRKRVVEERWLRSRKAWMAFPTTSFTPTETGTGTYCIPAARRVIERTAVRCTKLLTPSVKWHEVQPMLDVSQDKLSNIDAYMTYVLQKKIKARSNISQLCRTMLMYGVAVQKTSVSVKNGQVWPAQRAVDPFAFYIYPETSPTIEEAELVFEDFLFSYQRYATFAEKGIVDDLPQSAFGPPQWPYHLVERLAYQGITDPTANVDIALERNRVSEQLRKTTAGFVSMTELWITREDKLYQVYIAWNMKNSGPRIVGFFQSVYNEPLYRMAIHRPLPNETYTSAQVEDITELNSVQNDMFNQFKESVDREQGLVAFGGSSGIRRDSLKFKGGAKWDFGDERPQEVMQFIQPPVTSTNQLRAWQITNAMMQSMGGAGTIAEGQPGRNMPRSGAATSQLVNLGMADVQDIAEIIEQEILTPGLADIYKVSSLIPQSQLMRVPGGTAFYNGQQSNILKQADIIGDCEFAWVGSLQFQDGQQRAQRLMIFLNMVPSLNAELAKEGKQLSVSELLIWVLRYGLGERSLNKIVIPLQQPPMQLGQPMPPGQQSQPNQPPVSNVAQPTPGLKYNLPTVTNGFIR